MGYYDAETVDPGRISLLGHRQIPLLLDDLVVSSENPLFADQNRDALSDAYQKAYGSAGRDSDGDSDGLADIEEFLVRTNPSLADTDGDGLGDGEELANGRNPLDVSDANAESAIGFGFYGLANALVTYCSNGYMRWGIDYHFPSATSPRIRIDAMRVYTDAGHVVNRGGSGWKYDDFYFGIIGWSGGLISGKIEVEWSLQYPNVVDNVVESWGKIEHGFFMTPYSC